MKWGAGATVIMPGRFGRIEPANKADISDRWYVSWRSFQYGQSPVWTTVAGP